jgi:hypothetical protein
VPLDGGVQAQQCHQARVVVYFATVKHNKVAMIHYQPQQAHKYHPSRGWEYIARYIPGKEVT